MGWLGFPRLAAPAVKAPPVERQGLVLIKSGQLWMSPWRWESNMSHILVLITIHFSPEILTFVTSSCLKFWKRNKPAEEELDTNAESSSGRGTVQILGQGHYWRWGPAYRWGEREASCIEFLTGNGGGTWVNSGEEEEGGREKGIQSRSWSHEQNAYYSSGRQ